MAASTAARSTATSSRNHERLWQVAHERMSMVAPSLCKEIRTSGPEQRGQWEPGLTMGTP